MKWVHLTTSYSDRISEFKSLNPYERLGLHHGASNQNIRDAYLKLIRVYHPDKADPFMARYHEEITKLINEAYERIQKDR